MMEKISFSQGLLDDRLGMLNIEPTDCELLLSARSLISEHLDTVLDAFYAHLLEFGHIKDFLRDDQTIESLRAQLVKSCMDMFAGVYDLHYVESRLMTGLVHNKLGIPLYMYLTSLGYLKGLISNVLHNGLQNSAPTIHAFEKVAMLDIGLVTDSYSYSSQADLSHAKKELSKKYSNQLSLLESVNKLQKAFIASDDPKESFELLLSELINLTDSEFGYIGDVLYDESGSPYLKIDTLTNISWNEETRKLYEQRYSQGLEFHNLDNLIGASMTTGEPVITNDPASDPRSSGTPAGHPELKRYLGLPFKNGGKVVGMVGLANSQYDYDEALIQYLSPLLNSLQTLTEAKNKKIELSRMKRAMDQALDAIMTFDPLTLKFTYANVGAEKQLGYSRDEILELSPFDIKPAFNKESLMDKLTPLMNGEKPYLKFETTHQRKDGELREVEIFIQYVIVDNYRHEFINIIHDITDRKRLEIEREGNEQRLLNLMDLSDDAMLVLGEELELLDCNKSAQNLLGMDQQTLERVFAEGDSSPRYGNFSALKHAIKDNGWQTGYHRFEWRYRGPDGRDIPIELTLTPMVFRDRQAYQIIGRDLTEIKANEEKVNKLAYYDELTDLPNRNRFADITRALLAIALREKRYLAMVCMGIVNLRDINDTLGHATGDKLIRAVSQRLTTLIRGMDAFGPTSKYNRQSDTLARLTGDEFALSALVQDLTAAPLILERLNDALAEPFIIDGSEIHVKMHYGVAFSPDDGRDFQTLLRHATIAYHISKADYIQTVFYDKKIGHDIQRRALIAQRLEHAVNTGTGLEIKFHPQVALKDNKLIGAEVLVRWSDEKLGSVPPSEFIPLAEDRGLIPKLTLWVIRKALSYLHQWMDETADERLIKDRNDFTLAINISTKDLEFSGFVEQALRATLQNRISMRNVEFELTETSIMQQPKQAIQTMSLLRAEGFDFAIDDFGTGHSSLTYLRDVAPQLLKIDMSFVKDMLSNDASRKVVQAVIATARIFEIETLAEGVEDEETAQLLNELGCDYGQGYLYSIPLSAEEFAEQWLSRMEMIS